MKTLHVLLVEDEPSAALNLEQTLTEIIPAVVFIKFSGAEASKVLLPPLDIGFLELDVANENTYSVAHALIEKNVPFAFVGSGQTDLPIEFQAIPFISKPFSKDGVARLLWGAES